MVKSKKKKYKVGSVVTGKVARMTDFGAFVELAPGIDALLHVSQISKEHVAKPSDVLSIGQEIQAKVVDFNGEDKKISLSMKALEAPAEEAPASGEGTQIDAVSGATKSSTAAVNGINDAYNFLQTVK